MKISKDACLNDIYYYFHPQNLSFEIFYLRRQQLPLECEFPGNIRGYDGA